MVIKPLNSKEKGQICENVACKYLINKGFSIVSRNYRKKWGEIDVVASKNVSGSCSIHFIEVKGVIDHQGFASREMLLNTHRPEDNVHTFKVLRLKRTIGSYLAEYGLSEKIDSGEVSFYFHVITVRLDFTTRRARVNMLENVIL